MTIKLVVHMQFFGEMHKSGNSYSLGNNRHKPENQQSIYMTRVKGDRNKVFL